MAPEAFQTLLPEASQIAELAWLLQGTSVLYDSRSTLLFEPGHCMTRVHRGEGEDTEHAAHANHQNLNRQSRGGEGLED